MTERLLMIDSAKTVLETIKVTARLSRTEQEAIDFAIDELGKKEDLLETLKDIKDNVYLQGRADATNEFVTRFEKENITDANTEKLKRLIFEMKRLAEQLQKGDLNDRLF